MYFVSGIILLLSLVNGIHNEALNLNAFDQCVRRTDGYVCYSAVDTPDVWSMGQSICAAKDMTMLEILTDDENSAVLDLLNRKNMVDTWLAAVQSTDSWRWLDQVVLGDQGCFIDNSTDPDMEYMVEFPSNNSVTNCIDHCKSLSYAYASVEAGSKCFCGDIFGKYGQQDNANCGQAACPGNSNQRCGGIEPLAQQIYAVDGVPANWLPGQPNNNNGYQSCAMMDSYTNYEWQDVFCRDGYKAICELPIIDNRCSNSKAVLVNGRCLMVTGQESNYFRSRYSCRQLGGDLVMHLTSTETQAITAWLNLPFNVSAPFYIGLAKWQWKWQTASEFLYTNWKYDQPTGPNFNCITMKRDGGGWVAIGCDSSHLYVCQKTNATKTVTAPLFTLAPTTTPKRTAPPPLPTTTRGLVSLLSTPRSTLNQSEQPSNGSSSSHPTSNSNQAAIIGGAVAGGVLLLVIICVVVFVFAACGATCCLWKGKDDSKEKGGISGAETTSAPPPPSYFFGVETTPKYRNGDKPSHASIPDFDTRKSGATFGRSISRNGPRTPDVVPPPHPYPMATPYEEIEPRAVPNPYSSDIYINPELSY